MRDKGFIIVAVLAGLAYFLWKKYGSGTTTTTVQSSVVGGVPNLPTTTVYDSSGAMQSSNVIRDLPGNIGPAIFSPSQGWISPTGHAPVTVTGSPVPVSVPNVPSPQQRVTPISGRMPIRYTSSTPINSILASKVSIARVA